MKKAELEDLIARINTPREKDAAVSSETVNWKAYREAETIADPGVFPLLREIITGNEGKSTAKREIRNAACFIYGRVAEKAFAPGDCAFLLERLEAETNKYILHQMLERVKDWRDRAGILLPPELDTTPVRRLAADSRWLVRHSAIHALCACPGPESRALLTDYLTQEDEKKYRYEMWYAAIAMQSIGKTEDIAVLERLLKSRRQDLRITARCAIQLINERAQKALKEVIL